MEELTAKAKKGKEAPASTPSLFYVHTPSGFYEILGDEGLKTAQRDLLKRYWQANAKAILVDDEGLDYLKMKFEENGVPFSVLKEAKA